MIPNLNNMKNIEGHLNIIIFGLIFNLIISFSLYVFQISGVLERTGVISVKSLDTILTLMGLFIFIVIISTIIIGYKIILNNKN